MAFHRAAALFGRLLVRQEEVHDHVRDEDEIDEPVEDEQRIKLRWQERHLMAGGAVVGASPDMAALALLGRGSSTCTHRVGIRGQRLQVRGRTS